MAIKKSKVQSPKSKGKKRFAKKSLGQNFLIDQNYINKIISSLNPQNDETIIEIGAGRGALTKQIVEQAGKVLAIEIDRELVPILRDEFKLYDNFHLIESDALEVDFQSLIALQSSSRKTKLVANLPYYISTAILQHLIQYRFSFSEMVLMLQREVVERITAEVGTKQRGFLTVLIEAYFDTEKLFDVPPNAFRPVPKVTSSVMRLTPKTESDIDIKDGKLFRDLVSVSFQQKRKTILNNLKNSTGIVAEQIERIGGVNKGLEEAKIDSKKRAESIAINDWKKLYNLLSK